MSDTLTNTLQEPNLQAPSSQAVHNKKLGLKAAVLAVFVIVVILAGGVYLFGKHKPAPDQLGSYTSYTLKGRDSGDGISFLEPGKLEVDPSSTSLPIYVSFNYQSNGHSVGYISAESAFSGKSYYQSFEKPMLIKESKLKDPGAYKNLTGLTQFINRNVPYGTNVHYSAAKIFTNSTISANAWQFDLTLTSKDNSRKIQGRVVYILGKNTYYIFLVAGQSNKWQADQPIWQKVLDSIKINQ